MPNCLTLKKSNCKNCYKCIRHCPVKAIRFSGNQAHIIGNECILCGHCFVVCPQNAKEIVDETEKAKVLLQSGDPVIVSIAPSFIANYEGVGINAMRRALKKLGFYDVEETAVGATIVKTEYERMLREDERDVIITSCCHSINLLIQKHFPATGSIAERRIRLVAGPEHILKKWGPALLPAQDAWPRNRHKSDLPPHFRREYTIGVLLRNPQLTQSIGGSRGRDIGEVPATPNKLHPECP